MNAVTGMVCVVACAAAAGVAGAQPLVSLFDTSSEGWTVETHDSPRGTFDLVMVYAPDYAAVGGARAGTSRRSTRATSGRSSGR